MGLLLDTCAAIWIAEGTKVGRQAIDALEETEEQGGLIFLSPITAWEIGILTSKGRLTPAVRPEVYFRRFFDLPHVRLAEMSPDLLIASSFLPGAAPRDPADRIIATTAREFGHVLVTRDRTLLAYGEEGHIQAIPC